MPFPRPDRLIRRAALTLAAGILATAATAAPREDPGAFAATDLGAYLERAFAANPELEAFHQRYAAALARVPQARSLPDPVLQVTQFVESVQTRTGPQEQAVMLNQRLPWFGKRRERAASASAEAEALWDAYEARQLDLARSVATAYYEYAHTGRALSLMEENVALLAQLEPIVEERVRGGGALNALLRLKVETGRVNDRLRSLEQLRATQSARLAALLALPAEILLPLPPWSVPERVPEGSLAELLPLLEARHPELAMLARQIDSAAARRELARLEAYPDLTVGLNYIHLGKPLNPGVPDAGRDPWGVTVALTLPLWRGRIDAQQDEALATQRAAEATLASRTLQLKADLSAAHAQLRDAERRLDLYATELLDLAQQAADNSRAGYESGHTSILELIDSERSLLELELLASRAATDLWQSRIALRALTGASIAGAPLPTARDR